MESDSAFWDASPIPGKPEPPTPKEGCVCSHCIYDPQYCRPHQPLDCPGGDLCFTALGKQKGRAITRAITEMLKLGICVCHAHWIKRSGKRHCGTYGVPCLAKKRRERTPRCACGMYFSNDEVRQLGLHSKSEWRRMGYKPKKDEKPKVGVWRTIYRSGVTGGRIGEVWLYSQEQVVELRRSICTE